MLGMVNTQQLVNCDRSSRIVELLPYYVYVVVLVMAMGVSAARCTRKLVAKRHVGIAQLHREVWRLMASSIDSTSQFAA